MNYLAHLFLSGDNIEIQAGNLFGDEVKGKSYENYSKNIKVGLLHHRFIDSYTDSHQVNLDTKKIFYHKMGKYAGIALDIYYDHFLAKKWDLYSEVPLDEYTQSIYELLKPYSLHFSDRSQHMLEIMAKYNWLFHYSELEGMQKTFSGMAKRLGNNSGMVYAFELLEEHYATIEASFTDYFPDLVLNANNKLLALQELPK